MRFLRYILIGLSLFFGAKAPAQPGRPYTLSIGLSTNPGLMVIHQEYELGPAISVTTPLARKWELGLGVLSRKVWYVKPDAQLGYKKNITYPYNFENLYSIHLGYSITKQKWAHTFQAVAGLRHELYKERLVNTELGIDETYRLNESNLMFGLAYALKYRLKENRFLSLRWLLPINREPFDDVNRHSLELLYQFPLRRK